MIATRLNRALKTEQHDFVKLCLVLVTLSAIGYYVFKVKLVAIIVLSTIVIIIRNMQVEHSRIFTCGNKYKTFLILPYLAGLSNSTEISDKVAEDWNNLDQESRKKICFKLDIILMLLYSIPILIYYYFVIWK